MMLIKFIHNPLPCFALRSLVAKKGSYSNSYSLLVRRNGSGGGFFILYSFFSLNSFNTSSCIPLGVGSY